jgi:hypothetical protein
MNARKTEINKNCPNKLAGLVVAEVKKKIKGWVDPIAFAGKNIRLLFLRRPIGHQ